MTELWQRGRVELTWSPAHELHGLQVTMRRRPLGRVIEAWLVDGEDEPRSDLTMKEVIERRRRDADELASLVVSWNLADDEGAPVPITGEGVLDNCDQAMISAMWRAYNDATVRVPPPLPESSGAGPAVSQPDPPEDWGPAQETLPA